MDITKRQAKLIATKMTPSLKRAWVKKLRSGRYKQGKSQLCNAKGKYCCIGVLGRTIGFSKQEMIGEPYLRALQCHVLPDATAYALAALNDNQGKSFNEIADYIDENL